MRGGLRRLSFAFPGPLDFRRTLERFRLAPEEPVNRFDGSSFRRALRVGGEVYLAELKATGPRRKPLLELTVRGPRPGGRALQEIRKMLEWTLGSAFDLKGFYLRAKEDRVMAGLAKAFFGLRPPCYPCFFEALVTAVTAQQVNLAFAGRVRAAMVKSFGGTILLDGEAHFAFPSPEELGRASIEEFRALKLSRNKARTILALSRAASSGELDPQDLMEMDIPCAVKALSRFPGVGAWTAETALFRGLGRSDALPAGDLGVRKAVGRLYLERQIATTDEARAWGREWGAYSGLAAIYLLRALQEGMV